MFTIGKVLRVLILFHTSIFLLFNSLILKNTLSFGLFLKFLFILAQRLNFLLNRLIIHVDVLNVGETTLGGF